MKYIAIEGIDGSGKTTLANNLKNVMIDMGFPCITIKEPNNEWIREAIKYVKDTEPRNEDEILANLFAADRLILKNQIFEYLYDGICVISDRSKFSSYAYQYTDLYYNTLINQYALDPHAVFYLDIDPMIAQNRYIGDDKFENSVLLKNVRAWYLNNLHPMVEDIQAIYAELNVDTKEEGEVTDFFKGILIDLLGEKNAS